MVGQARISEESRVIRTYPFSEPNRVPILTRDARLYPYHSFEGYATDPVDRRWQVVRLENDFIEVFVLPEVGGKVWGAVVKKTGHEFIYRNEVLKFRNIALRGPWTSGGIEFNFGVIGHTPSTATPVDYLLRENPDGSVSCIVGAMDLPSRTHWRVEIRLPADRAYFETNVLWYNPTPLEQPYYNWMTAAAFARPDLEMFIPGNAFLEHSGARRDWPFDSAGRFLPRYSENTFGGHKSYHVVGELNDFFGGYYHDDDYGFGHWARYEDMPGQKLWLWALSREGGVWEDLLTDSDGQYVEYQAGRLLVQYAPGRDVNPVTQVGFDPGATDHWSETWFPVEGIGGISDASRDGVLFVNETDGRLSLHIQALREVTDSLLVFVDDSLISAKTMSLQVLEPQVEALPIPPNRSYRVALPMLGLDYRSDSQSLMLSRPFPSGLEQRATLPDVDRWLAEASELAQARMYADSRSLYERVLNREEWNREALLGMANLEYRRGAYSSGLEFAHRALELDTYDAEANFVAGILYRATGRLADAHESFGWALRSMSFRSVAYVQLAELALVRAMWTEADRYARLALDYDRYNLSARQTLSMLGRVNNDSTQVSRTRREMLQIDPMHHFALTERYLDQPNPTSRAALLRGLGGEYPEQTLLELAIDYARRGFVEDAVTVLDLRLEVAPDNPLLRAWHGWLRNDVTVLEPGAELELSFPYRHETIRVLQWAVENSSHWSWRYLLSLNLWGRDRLEEAGAVLQTLANEPDFAPAFVARAHLLRDLSGRDPEADLRRAAQLAPDDRLVQIELVRFYHEQRRWSDALDVTSALQGRFPGDFDIDLLHARSLLNLRRAAEAVEVLQSVRVLPSENSGLSHRLYQQSHTMAGIDALSNGQSELALSHFRAAMEWPERLGQGRPYVPEERLQAFGIGLAAMRLGRQVEAEAAFEQVVGGTDLSRLGSDLADLLAVSALYHLDRLDVTNVATSPEATPQKQIVETALNALREGVPFKDVVSRIVLDLETEEIETELLARLIALTP